MQVNPFETATRTNPIPLPGIVDLPLTGPGEPPTQCFHGANCPDYLDEVGRFIARGGVMGYGPAHPLSENSVVAFLDSTDAERCLSCKVVLNPAWAGMGSCSACHAAEFNL